MDSVTGFAAAGDFPWVKALRFAKAQEAFLNNLKAHGQASS